MPSPKGLLFDKDGTLLDYHATWMPANRAVAKGLADGDAARADELLAMGGWDKDSDRIRAGTTLAAANLAEIAEMWHPVLSPGKAADFADRADMIRYLDSTFLAHMVPTPVCDLPDLLDRLAGLGMAMGVATADSENGLHMSLSPFQILDRFAFAVGYDSGHGCKPGPGMVQGFCATVGIDPAEVWVIGDNSHDIEMALAAGAVGIGVLTGTSDEAVLMDAGATTVLPSIADLPAILAAPRH